MTKTGIIIQVRTGSTRLPNKVILPFHNGDSILDILLKKIQFFKKNYNIILSTTNSKNDDIIIDYANKYKINFFRGSESNVLKRFVDTAENYELDTVVRICSDNPFIDIYYIEQLINIFKQKPNLHYCSFMNSLCVPVIKTHIGLFGEVVCAQALKNVQNETKQKLYLEHVTNYIYENPKKYNLHFEKSFSEVYNRQDLRFTIDDMDDFDNLREVFETYKNYDFDIKKTIKFIDKDQKIKERMMNNIKIYNK